MVINKLKLPFQLASLRESKSSNKSAIQYFDAVLQQAGQSRNIEALFGKVSVIEKLIQTTHGILILIYQLLRNSHMFQLKIKSHLNQNLLNCIPILMNSSSVFTLGKIL